MSTKIKYDAYSKLSALAKECFSGSIWTEKSKSSMAHWHIPMGNQQEKFNFDVLCELVEFMKLSGLNQRIFEIEILVPGITAEQIMGIVCEPAFPQLEELYVFEVNVCLQLIHHRADLLKAMPAFRLLEARWEYTPEEKPMWVHWEIEK